MGLLYNSQEEAFLPAVYRFYQEMEAKGEALEQNATRAAMLARPLGSYLKWAGKAGALFLKGGRYGMGEMNCILSAVVGGVALFLAYDGIVPLSGALAASGTLSLPLIIPLVAAGVSGVVGGTLTGLNRFGENIRASLDAHIGLTPKPPAAVVAAANAAIQDESEDSPAALLQDVRERLSTMSSAEKQVFTQRLAQEFGFVSRDDVVKADLADSASRQPIKARSLVLNRNATNKGI